MKNKKINKTLKGKTGKELLGLVDSKSESSGKKLTDIPQSETGKVLSGFWKELLGHSDFGFNDDFFLIGGNSIKAIQLLSRISSHFTVQPEVTDLFLHPTISEQSELISNLQNKSSVNGTSIHQALIIKKERPSLIPLSFSQERLLFIDRLEGTLQYHVPAVIRLKGTINIKALEFALKQIVKRHEVLRTVFREKEGESYQFINEADDWNLGIIDKTDFENGKKVSQEFIHKLINNTFDLSKDFMIRADLIKLKEDDHLLVVTMHHIASDGWSISVLVKEVIELYSSFIENREFNLPHLNVQYADFAIWQRRNMKEEVLEKRTAYWKNKLEGLTTLQLPTDFPRPAVQSKKGDVTEFFIERELTEKLKYLSSENGVTMFMILLSAFKVLLYRYSGQSDICVGTPVANRTNKDIEPLIGLFINTLPLRSNLGNNPKFSDLLQQIKSTTTEAYSHQDTPFEKIVEAVVTERDPSRNPIYQVMLTLQNTPEDMELRSSGLAITKEKIERTTSQLDIICNITETGNGLQCDVDYCTDLYEQKTIDRMMIHFKELLNSIVTDPDQRIGDIQMLAKDEKNQLLNSFNKNKISLSEERTIIDLFYKQSEKFPDKAAVIFKGKQFTFREINERSNQLANYLRSKGVKDEMLVPVCMDSSQDMIVSIIAILKSGAAYVPIDPEYPQDRIKFMLQDTGASVLVCNNNSTGKLDFFKNAGIINIDRDDKLISGQSSDNLTSKINPNNLAYVIYTSGSTGKPKGVMVGHGSLYNYLLNSKTKYISDAPGSTGSFIHLPYTFDASLTALFMPLLNGKSVVIGNKKSFDVFEDDNLIKFAPFDFIKITPSHLELLKSKMRIKDGRLLTQKLVIGGEELNRSQLNFLIEAGMDVEVINEYGPTEATVGCSVYSFNTSTDIDKINNSIPIGKPIDNLQLYILGEHNELLPLGIAGEICIGGEGLARGYLNRSDLTEEKFITVNFENESALRLYKTGDMARWREDGNLEFLGRKDEQLKIRGYRIESGEIESIILESKLVKTAVVLAKENNEGGKRLVAYVVPEENFDKEKLLHYLKAKLPEYMIPVQWMEVESIPLTLNGKTDKKALLNLDSPESSAKSFVSPRNEFESALAEIWAELLDADTVGIHDNFFELGGDSIIIIQIVSRARKAGYNLEVADVFSHQTIAKLSEIIESKTGTSSEVSGEHGLLKGECGLLPIQQWFFEGSGDNVNHFNQSVLLNIDKSVTDAELKNALKELFSIHDALRFKYKYSDGKWNQEYGDFESQLYIEDLHSIEKNSFESEISKRADKYQRNLNIENGDLVRMVWMQTPESEISNRLLMVIHHLAIDGISWRILLEDLELLINGQKSGTAADNSLKGSSYRQWNESLIKYSKSNELISQISQWENIAGKYKPLTVDKDYTGIVKVKDLKHLESKLGTVQTRRLIQDVPQVYHTEINDILLSALLMTISEFEKSESIVISLEGHGRESIEEGIDLSRTAGWFTSVYPVLLESVSDKHPSAIIKTVKEQLRLIPDKGLGYGVLKYIVRQSSLTDFSNTDIIFNYLGQADNVLGSGKWISLANESSGSNISEDHEVFNKIAINGIVKDGELKLNWSYSTLHFENERIEKLSQKYISNLEMLIDHCTGQDKSGAVFTPSDFGFGKEISVEELDKFLSEPFGKGTRKDYIESMYALSGLQQGMLFHSLYDESSGVYVEQIGCDLVEVDIEIFRKSWSRVLSNHSILRSGFYYDTFSVPVQCVYRDIELPIEVHDYTYMNGNDITEALREYEESDRLRDFDFKSVPLMRVSLIRVSENRYRMLWTSHHILFDGWSTPVMLEEFLKTYEDLITGKEMTATQEDRYEDYIRYIDRSDKDQQLFYWRNYMQGVEYNTLLPFIGNTNQRTKGIGEYSSEYLVLSPETSAQIELYSQKHRVTINTIMQSVWSFLLHQYTGNDDVLYGIVVSGRPDDLPGIEKRVGMYINTLPLRSRMDNEIETAEWLQKIQSEQISSRKYQYTSLQDIQSQTPVKGDLFDTLLVFENYPISKVASLKEWKLQVENFYVKEQTNYPLTIVITISDQLTIDFRFNERLIEKENVNLICDHYEHVLRQIISESAKSTGDIKMLTSAEEHQLLVEFNNTDADYLYKSVIGLFEEQAAKTPDNVALVYGDQHITYKELNERSNQLAHYLRGKGVKEETLVPICIERNMNMIIGILGILKAGAAYVPMDPEYPRQRINYMLEDTGALLVVSSRKGRAILDIPSERIIDLDTDWNIINNQPTDNLQSVIKPHHLTHVIYTSGSTGKPKGVMIENKNVHTFISWCKEEFQLSHFDIVYATTSICFDLSVYEIFYPLSIGKPVRILENGLEISKYLNDDSFVLLNCVPGVIENLLKEEIDLSNVSVINMAGEPISLYVQQNLDTNKIEVRNLYGPTEDTTYSTNFRLEKGKPLLIGKPIANTKIYIVNKDNDLVPVSITGEILIGGSGIARGYLNREELTAERFIKNPFIEGERVYRTGDIGRWLPDGNIEYLGRMDGQVKIRGFRIELGEIENVLQECDMVQQSVVLARTNKEGSKRLVGYVVPKKEFEKEAIMFYLSSRLPDYMIPNIWVEMEKLPLTQNGKIDRKALPDPEVSELISSKYEAPRNEMELMLAEIWKDLLHVERVGIHDNFFELGGDSIITIQVISRTHRLGYELKPKDIFIHQTIDKLSELITERSEESVTGEQGYLSGRSGLLPIQQWYFERADADISHFNQSILLKIEKSVTSGILTQAVDKLTAHHDALRFKYEKQDSGWIQEYGTYTGVLNEVDLRSSPEDSLDILIQEHAGKFQSSLNITKGILVMFVLIHTPENERQNRILIIIHHLAVDGISWRILLDDLEMLITALQKDMKAELGNKTSSYRHWYDVLDQYAKSTRLLSQSRYWDQVIKNYQPLVYDKNYSGAVKANDIVSHEIRLDLVQTKLLLQEVPRLYNTDINDILLSSLALTFCNRLNSEKIVIGIEGHGRENIADDIDISRTAGWFTSLYPVMLEVAAEKDLPNTIRGVKEKLRRVPDKGLGYGVLKFINKDEKLAGKDCWDIVFNYLGQLDNLVVNSKWFSGKAESAGNEVSGQSPVSEKLTINSFIQEGQLVLKWNYSSRHFNRETITMLADEYLSNLSSLIAHCTGLQKSFAMETPSDYGLGPEISIDELDTFLNERL